MFENNQGHRKRHFLLLLLAGVTACFTGAQANDPCDLTQCVRQLGLQVSDPAYGFDLLAQKPHQAVALLVDQLHSIKRGLYYESKKTDQSRHILACLRALHYITGRTFVSATGDRLNDDERQFLDFDKQVHDQNPSHKIHFFGVWMSRDAEYVAPKDAQLAIIEEWKHFQKAEGETFAYKPAASAAKSMEDWYWFG